MMNAQFLETQGGRAQEPIALQCSKQFSSRPTDTHTASFFPDDCINQFLCDTASGMHLAVMTPVYPPGNAAANVTGSSFAAVYSEIKKAVTLFKFQNKKQLHNLIPSSQNFWDVLFEA